MIRTARTNRTRRGMTLIELIVSVGVLLVMLGSFNVILRDAQNVVNTSQETMRANGEAIAISRLLRSDLQAATKEGFLMIVHDASRGYQLIFTAGGIYRSLTEDDRAANAARIEYGVTGDGALFRRAILLDPTATSDTGDVENMSLDDYSAMDPNAIDDPFTSGVEPPSLTIPPTSIQEVRDMWPFVASPVSDLVIEYTLGEVDANDQLIWEEIAQGDYAHWTHGDKRGWPSAIRLKYTLGPAGMQRRYDVTCDIMN